MLFAHYVRMLRARGPSLALRLSPASAAYFREQIDPDAWYPMAVFEELGLAILESVAAGHLGLVRAWGRVSVAHLAAAYPALVVRGDPAGSLTGFQVMGGHLFDFDALTMRAGDDTSASLEIDYGMSPLAEEAACHQAMGFFEGLVAASGGREVTASFGARRWRGAPRTELTLGWAAPL